MHAVPRLPRYDQGGKCLREQIMASLIGVRVPRDRSVDTAALGPGARDRPECEAQDMVGGYLQSLKEFPPTRGSSLSIDKVLEKMKTQKAGQ